MFAANAILPTATFSEPVVLAASVPCPIEVLLAPVKFAPKAP